MTMADSDGEAEDLEPDPSELRSYGRRKGRKLGARQQRLVDELLPRVRIAPGIAGGPIDPATAFGDAASEVWLEIGFGGGEHLLWHAARHPGVGMIGCEPFIDGVVKVLAAIEERGLGNIRLWDDDARDLLRRLPAASISRAFVLFPDPWPKARHRKRRLVAPRTLALLARVMKPGAELRIGTDIADYVHTMLVAFAATPEFVWQAAAPSDWRVRRADWPETRYEQKAKREGRRCYYFRFRRV